MTSHRRPPGRPRSDQGDIPIPELILKNAIPLFLGRGYEGVSMDDVAKQCGITKASVYYYFPSKAELLTASMIALMNNIRKITILRLSQPLPLRERLLDITQAHLQAIDFDFDSFMRKMESTMSAEQMEAMRLAEQGLFDALEIEFAKASASGEIGFVDPRITARAYVALLMMGHAKDAHGLSLFASKQEAAEKIIELLWNGLSPK
ncbi:Biofilm operon icaADBC HTH-type negative transcriptional regulator IcaR [compost metagenome]